MNDSFLSLLHATVLPRRALGAWSLHALLGDGNHLSAHEGSLCLFSGPCKLYSVCAQSLPFPTKTILNLCRITWYINSHGRVETDGFRLSRLWSAALANSQPTFAACDDRPAAPPGHRHRRGLHIHAGRRDPRRRPLHPHQRAPHRNSTSASVQESGAPLASDESGAACSPRRSSDRVWWSPPTHHV